MKISFANLSVRQAGVLVVGVYEEKHLSNSAKAVDDATGGALSRAIACSRFSGKRNQVLDIMAPSGVRASRIVLIGLGKPAALDFLAIESAGGTVAGHLSLSGQAKVFVALDPVPESKAKAPELAARFAYGARLGSYRFDRYRTKMDSDERPSLAELTVTCRDAASARKEFRRLAGIADGVCMTRDLVSEPANVKFAQAIAEDALGLRKLGVKVEVLGEQRMRRLGMNALLAVNQGSAREAKLVVMQWNGAPTRGGRQRPVAFIGKGVTFDSGGISIKPSAGMEDMKWDMAGAGTVIGLMRALATRRARANVVGVCGLVENMPSGTAQRPGDVVVSMSGQTVEVINTDAEGRLVLADAMWYTQKRFKPVAMVDLATLTGAIIVSLGHVYAGLFSDSDDLSEALVAAGKAEGEPLWRMPLDDQYDKNIRSDIADMKNVGGRAAGSITAAQFLKRFTNKVPWAHLDIAGVAWSSKSRPTVPKGGTAFGVRLLDRLVADRYES
jgi:leucyl aminopeptidase